MNKTARIVARIIIILIATLVSLVLLGYGLQGSAFVADGTQEIVPWALVVATLYLPLVIILLIIGRHHQRAEKAFWYLGIGVPLAALVPLILL